MFSSQQTYSLPNGLIVARTNVALINELYSEIFENEIYLQHGITLDEESCIVDAGANTGFFTLFAYNKCLSAHIYAFEPIPTTFKKLCTNVALNNIKAELFECGLSNRTGEEKFTSYLRFNTNSSRFSNLNETYRLAKALVVMEVENKRRQQISPEELESIVETYFLKREVCKCQVRTLSSVIKSHQIERIDLLKIDTEGSEFDILVGIDEPDWPKIRQVAIEVHGNELLKCIVPVLEKQGYIIFIDSRKNLIADTVGDYSSGYLYMVYGLRKI